jgi:hypothetical protein
VTSVRETMGRRARYRASYLVEAENAGAAFEEAEDWEYLGYLDGDDEASEKDWLGDYREFLNFVPTTFDKIIDIFLTYVTEVDSIEILHKFTCIERKTVRATEQD